MRQRNGRERERERDEVQGGEGGGGRLKRVSKSAGTNKPTKALPPIAPRNKVGIDRLTHTHKAPNFTQKVENSIECLNVWLFTTHRIHCHPRLHLFCRPAHNIKLSLMKHFLSRHKTKKPPSDLDLDLVLAPDHSTGQAMPRLNHSSTVDLLDDPGIVSVGAGLSRLGGKRGLKGKRVIHTAPAVSRSLQQLPPLSSSSLLAPGGEAAHVSVVGGSARQSVQSQSEKTIRDGKVL